MDLGRAGFRRYNGDMSPRLDLAIEAAFEAGRGTLAHFQNGPVVDRKSDASPVTVADREAEQTMRRFLERHFPGEAILGEEFGGEFQGNGWLLDPIDGTRSFVAGVPLFATLLSYEEAGEPQLGVAYFPALELMVYAELGAGCYANGRRCQVSPTPTLDNATVATAGIPGLRKAGLLEAVAKLTERLESTRSWCDAYGHVLVAMGQVDAMIDPSVARWDISPVSVIVREAGGKFTQLNGEPGLGSSAISSNGYVHDELRRALAG